MAARGGPCRCCCRASSVNFLPYVAGARHHGRGRPGRARCAGNWTAYLNLGTPWLPACRAIFIPHGDIVGPSRARGATGWRCGTCRPGSGSGSGRPRGGRRTGRPRRVAGWPVPSRSTTYWTARSPHSERVQLEPVIAAVLALGLGPRSRPGWRRVPAGRQVPSAGFRPGGRGVVGLVLIGLMFVLVRRGPEPGLVYRGAALLVSGRLVPGGPVAAEHRAGGAPGCARRLPLG